MDSEGVIVDKNWKLSGASEEDVVQWYKNMLTGTAHKLLLFPTCPYSLTYPLSVSIMDLIMNDAQRQGRISFYMVTYPP